MTKVTVTQDHIDHGKKSDCALCPIALALCNLGYLDVEVHGTFVRLPVVRGRLFIDLPEVATDFIDQFDAHGAIGVSPIEFDLDLPPITPEKPHG